VHFVAIKAPEQMDLLAGNNHALQLVGFFDLWSPGAIAGCLCGFVRASEKLAMSRATISQSSTSISGDRAGRRRGRAKRSWPPDDRRLRQHCPVLRMLTVDRRLLLVRRTAQIFPSRAAYAIDVSALIGVGPTIRLIGKRPPSTTG
jgi:hypothetical protein